MAVNTSDHGFPPGTVLLENSESSFTRSWGSSTNYHEGNNSQPELILSPTPTDDPDDPLVSLFDASFHFGTTV